MAGDAVAAVHWLAKELLKMTVTLELATLL
jgi:hypothetical protein